MPSGPGTYPKPGRPKGSGKSKPKPKSSSKKKGPKKY